jgi:hypothetical protein
MGTEHSSSLLVEGRRTQYRLELAPAPSGVRRAEPTRGEANHDGLDVSKWLGHTREAVRALC